MKLPSMILGLCACAWLGARAQTPDAPPSARESHAAECVAALEVNTESLARSVKAGNETARPVLQARLESGTAFVGDSYLHGTTDETRARALATKALDAQKSLTDAQLFARQEACAAEGTKLFEASGPLEQAIVRRLARRRQDRLLAD